MRLPHQAVRHGQGPLDDVPIGQRDMPGRRVFGDHDTSERPRAAVIRFETRTRSKLDPQLDPAPEGAVGDEIVAVEMILRIDQERPELAALDDIGWHSLYIGRNGAVCWQVVGRVLGAHEH